MKMTQFFIIPLIFLSSCTTFPWIRTPPQERSVASQYQQHHPIGYSDVMLGMNMGEVIQAWGEPLEVHTAGERVRKNQKWVYPEGAAGTLSGGMARVLYFENGQLVGWERSPQTSFFQ